MDSKEYMHVPVFIRLFFHHLTLAEKWLYVCLADLCRAEQEHRLDLRTLEKETGLAKSTHSSILPRLATYGLIRAQKKPSGLTNHEAWHIALCPVTLEQAQHLSAQFEEYSERRNIAEEIEVIEHFVPVVLGGGTTQTNCVPACMQCNRKKNGYHPLLLPASIDRKHAIERVHQYLASQRSEVEL